MLVLQNSSAMQVRALQPAQKFLLMDHQSHELTLEKIMNQEWKYTHIIGYGVGMYIGSGPEAVFIAKGSTEQVALTELIAVYDMICRDHNIRLKAGQTWKKRRLPLWTRIKQLLPKKKFVLDIPAHIYEEPKENN